MTTFLTADHHFDHTNIINYCRRPFAGVEEMNAEMIWRWNATVGLKDEVFHLGDFTMGSLDIFLRYFRQLHGRIQFVPGGHDHRWARKGAAEMGILILPPLVTTAFGVLCHYPLASWEKSHFGKWHFHGHCHGTIGRTSLSGDIQLPPDSERGRRVDVGVDCWDFRPVALDELWRVK